MSTLPNFEAFVSTISGDVVTFEHPLYADAIARWAKNAERNARIVVLVKNENDVAQAIAFAKANKLPIAIRGGGHNAAGASSSEGGLVIDLNKYVNHVRVDVENKLAYVGGGAVWGQVDAETIKHGLATVAGTVSHTGVGGLTLGGGYGWLTGRHGLTLDNLHQVTLVTADGSIQTVNDTENSDLFWAIRGGGSNFGVVTEFVFKLHDQRKTIFGGMLFFSPDKIEKLAEVTTEWFKNIKADEGLNQLFLIGPHGQPVVAVFVFYNGTEEEGRENFKAFYDIGPTMDTAKEIPYEKLNSYIDHGVPHGKCYYLSGLSQSKPSLKSYTDIFGRVQELAKLGEFAPTIVFEYCSLEKIRSVDTAATAFPRTISSNILVSLKWEDPSRNDDARRLGKELIRVIGQGLQEEDKKPGGYSNYGHDTDIKEDDQHPSFLDITGSAKAENAFGDNYPRLQALKKRYDPENIFNRWYPITPA